MHIEHPLLTLPTGGLASSFQVSTPRDAETAPSTQGSSRSFEFRVALSGDSESLTDWTPVTSVCESVTLERETSLPRSTISIMCRVRL
jgi:hypothetical protein